MLRQRSGLFVLFLFLAAAAMPARAQDPADPGPMFLVIALDDANGVGEFDISELKTKGKDAGSDTIIVKVGTLQGGYDTSTDVDLVSSDPTFPIPKIQGSYLDFTTLNGNEATYVGSYEIYSFDSETYESHMLTTAAAYIDPDIQLAITDAAADLDAAVASDPFMKTGQIAGIVFDHLPSGSTVSLDAIAAAMFGPDDSPQVLLSGDQYAVECEGELFPHEPDAPKLFDFKFTVTKDSKGKSAKFSLDDLVRHVTVVMKEGTVNVDKQGNVPGAILSSGTFDATDVDVDTILLYPGVVTAEDLLKSTPPTGVAPSSYSISDQNGDGIDDLSLQFSVPDLVDAGLNADVDEVTLWAFLKNSETKRVTGTAAINTQ